MKRAVSSYLEDNLKPAKFDEDDSGLPESPVYANFSKHLWTTHIRHGLVQSPDRSRGNTDGPRLTQRGPSRATD
jgi:hypothetical protein